jgi:hypothetical protein
MSQLIEVLAKIDSTGGTIVVRDKRVLAQHRQDLLRLFAPAEPAVVDQADQDQHLDQGPPVVDLDAWNRDNTVEPAECDQCGGLERWQSIAGKWHCSHCDPPIKGAIIRERAAALRRRRYATRTS